MRLVVDYYFSPQSPWTYLGHVRFSRMAAAAGAQVDLLPMDLGQVFPVSGGLPLAQRAPQRQAYRHLELKRFAAYLGLPLNLQAKFFPVASHDASRLIIAVDRHDGPDAAMALTGHLTRAVWAEERDIAAEDERAAALAACGLPVSRLDDAAAPSVQALYDASTQRAIAAGVFGAPSYVIDGEMFWGQDRLDFVERRLAQA